jgi:hypothetical protein
MQVQQTTVSVGVLIHQIGQAAIRLPELQRAYVWRPTQVAKLIDSMYRGYPVGSLLFWRADEAPASRALDVTNGSTASMFAPLYLLDGQQRLTSLHRVFSNHPQAQIVFHVERQRFQNQSAITQQDPNWIKVAEALDSQIAVGALCRRVRKAGCQLPEVDIERRIQRVRSLQNWEFPVQMLSGFGYDEVAEIFVRVNSAGRHLSRADLAMSTLSAKWPGALDKFEKEAAVWQRQGYGDLDVEFLARAFSGALFGGGLSSWSVSDIDKVDTEKLSAAWQTVQQGLKQLVPLLQSDLKLARSGPLPSLLPLIPLVILLGERGNQKLDSATVKGILYWLLVAMIRSRYATSTDSNLNRDIQAARRPDPIRELLRNLGVLQSPPEITADSLAGRTKESPYFFLALLTFLDRGARDWWYHTHLVPGPTDDQQIQYHHVHPVATLNGYDKGDINELANLAFISRKANLKISDRSPADYFTEVGDQHLGDHLIPGDVELRTADAFLRFLAARRTLLAGAMNSLLEKFRPDWLEQVPAGPATSTDGYKLTMVLYGSAWASGRLVFRASGAGIGWSGSVDMDEFCQAVTTAGLAGIDSDVEIAGESVPVEVVEDSIQVPIGPFLVSGSAQEWDGIFAREQATMQSLGRLPSVAEKPWPGERIPLAVTSTD